MKPYIRNIVIAASPLATSLIHAQPAGPAGGGAASNPPREEGRRPSSETFAIGDRIETRHRTRVWVTPPTAGAYAGEQVPGAAGTIVSGPVRAAGTWWWQVDYDTEADGWSMQRDFLAAGSTADELPPLDDRPVGTATGATFQGVKSTRGRVSRLNKTVLRGNISHDSLPPSEISATINGKSLALDENGNFSKSVKLSKGKNTFTLEATTPNPRQQTTQISAYLDASMIYGSVVERANALRSFQGGAMKTTDGNLPPLNSGGFENDNGSHLYPDNELFLCGDVRANENIELTAIHALFVREHNQLAAALAAASPGLGDEEIYQHVRRLVTAEVQVITYREFLPALLGPDALRPYRGYMPHVNAGLATEFSTGAYRIGHTLINDDVEFMDNEGEEIREGLPLAHAFFNPAPLKESGPDPLLKYLATDAAQEVDTQIVDGLRDFLFGPPGAGGLDLASLNIQRSRDHGLADYNTIRTAYGLPAVTDVSQITRDAEMQARLLSLYGGVETMDLWVAGLAEDHVAGSSVGPTFLRIIASQFERTRDGDSNWYERVFGGPQLAALQATRLSDIIRRNTTITKLQENVFFFDDNTLAGLTEIAGSLPPELVQGPIVGMLPASLDGSGNNPLHDTWGAAGAGLLRVAPAAYADKVSEPSGADRPGARLISNTVAVHTDPDSNARSMSSFVYGWGQFVDHDMGLTTTGDTPFDIPVPTGDPSFDPEGTGTVVIPMTRSNYNMASGGSDVVIAKKVMRVNYKPRPQQP